jgi:ABC-type transporter Mla subunit MlaD/flagellar motor component MotA
VLYLTWGCLLLGTVLLGGNSGGMYLNYVFLAVMGCLIVWTNVFGISRVFFVAEEFKVLISRIMEGADYTEFINKEIEANRTQSPEETEARNQHYLELMERQNLTQHTVNEDWHRLLKDWQLSEGLDCDVADYLSEDEILENCNYSTCMQIPGILTALGILGTFLGLVLGLQRFDFSNADQMTSSVEALVSGLNVAFYTSIYGVSLSIVFNLVFRWALTDLNQSLNQFYDVFHAALKPASQKDMVEKFCDYQNEQNELLDEIRQLLDERFGERLAGQMAVTLTPVFERITQSLDHIILDFHKEQAASLEKIVDAFVEQMSGALNQHIHVLGDSVDQLSRTQDAMSEELKALIGQIAQTGADTAKINAQAGEIFEQLNGYVAQLEKTSGDSAEIIRQMSGWAENLQTLSATQNNVLSTLVQHEKNLDETCARINTAQETLGENLTEFSNAAAMLAKREQDPLQYNDLKEMLSAYMTSMQQIEQVNAQNMEAMWRNTLSENANQQEKRDQLLIEHMDQMMKGQQDLVYLNGRIAGILSGQGKSGKLKLPSGRNNVGETNEMAEWMNQQNKRMDAWMQQQEAFQQQLLEMESRRNRSAFAKIRDFFSAKND